MTTANRPEEAFHTLTDRELLEYLTETNIRLERLQDEVQRRMQEHAKTELRLEQHAEISKLVEQLEQATVDWRKVRDFFRDSVVEAQNPWRHN